MGGDVKVLVVDDAAANRKILSILLTRAGHEVIEAGDVGGALSVVGEGLPDVVVTDLHMPGGDDGVILARSLRARPQGPGIRIALMTGDAASYSDDERLFDAILDKPVLSKDLLDFIGA